MSDVPTLQTLLDRAEIRDVMARYARGLDRRDFELAASCFTDDAVADYGGEQATAHGIEAIVRILRAVEHFEQTTHSMGDQIVEFDGDTARVETYARDQLRYTRDGVTYDMTGGLRYEDTFVRTPDGWRIQHRVMHTDWRRHDPVVEAPGPHLGQGQLG